MSRNLVSGILIYLFFFAMGSALSAADLSALLPSTAPAAAPLDTLPQGRHQVSSFTNGQSTEFIVEGGEIVMLKIDGRDIPESEYDQYRERVEQMLGGGSPGGQINGFTFDIFEDMNDFEHRSERMERYFERQGAEWERMGEEMGKRFERMFQFDEESGAFRFDFDGTEGGVFEFNLDSLMQGYQFEMTPGSRGYTFDELMREKESDINDAEREIDELETMIERMERRKAEVERHVEAERTNDDGPVVNGFYFKKEVTALRSEGLIDPGVIRSFELSRKSLKVNGKKASDEAHRTLRERFEARTGMEVTFSLEYEDLEW